MDDKQTYFSITDEVLKDRDLNDFRKLLLMKIQALTVEYGFAFCSNKYLADLFGKDVLTISRNINFLIKNNYVIARYDDNNNRKLVLTKMYRAIDKDVNPPIDKDVNHNNKELNNKTNNTKTGTKVSFGEFGNVKLTQDEYYKVKELYKGLTDEAIEILDTYIESNGKKYKSHRAVLSKNNWVYKRLKEEYGSNKPMKFKPGLRTNNGLPMATIDD